MDKVKARYRRIKWRMVAAVLVWLVFIVLFSSTPYRGEIWFVGCLLLMAIADEMVGQLCCPKCHQPLGLRINRIVWIFRCEHCSNKNAVS